MVTELDRLRAECSDDALLARATNDAIAAMLAPLVGLSIPQAITALDQLREQLERARPHDQQQPISTIRIPGWRAPRA